LSAKKIAVYGLVIALAMILSYVEALVPITFAIQGMKLGLANIAVIFALFRLSPRDACVVSLLRVLLTSLLFGNMFSLWYSAGGAVMSLAVMIPLARSGKFGTVGVSAAGGVAHNIGQVLVAVLVLETGKLMFYLPVLLVSGTLAGALIGTVAGTLVKRLRLPEN
jgi:heptaprenyl diphosphate synthase